MKKQFKFDASMMYIFVGVVALWFLLIAIPGSLSGNFPRVLNIFILVSIILGVVSLGWARGTYITIDEDESIRGTVFFLKGKSTSLSDVVSLKTKKVFAGAMTYVYIIYRKKNGDLDERNIVARESLKKGDFKKFIEAIQSANPSIKISEDLLKK